MNKEIISKLHRESPLIHCITNPISITQCANTVLGIGAKPIMAEHPREVREITETASALLINLGNISDIRISAMEISMEAALEKGLPIVLDAVGVSCSELRREFAKKLFAKWQGYRVSGEGAKGVFVVKGNYSEIKALNDDSYRGKGVDADRKLTAEEVAEEAGKFALENGVVVMASGETDIVTGGKYTVAIRGGVPMMGDVTGTGCMLGALCAGFLAAEADIDSVIRASVAFGLAGELAYQHLDKSGDRYGNGSFLIKLLDEIYLMTDEKMEERICQESIKIL